MCYPTVSQTMGFYLLLLFIAVAESTHTERTTSALYHDEESGNEMTSFRSLTAYAMKDKVAEDLSDRFDFNTHEERGGAASYTTRKGKGKEKSSKKASFKCPESQSREGTSNRESGRRTLTGSNRVRSIAGNGAANGDEDPALYYRSMRGGNQNGVEGSDMETRFAHLASKVKGKSKASTSSDDAPSASPTECIDDGDIPSGSPSAVPSSVPTLSSQPSSVPSAPPSLDPTRSFRPSLAPSEQPSRLPSSTPSVSPSRRPSDRPSDDPSELASEEPSNIPSSSPSVSPSRRPSDHPSHFPSRLPSKNPSVAPSGPPSKSPSKQPSFKPSMTPSNLPSKVPSQDPTVSSKPTFEGRTFSPSGRPSKVPSSDPSGSPSKLPSRNPSPKPSLAPSARPSRDPSSRPSRDPSSRPSRDPSSRPSRDPSSRPSRDPSSRPSNVPSLRPSPIPNGRCLLPNVASTSYLSPSCCSSYDPNGYVICLEFLNVRPVDVAVLDEVVLKWENVIRSTTLDSFVIKSPSSTCNSNPVRNCEEQFAINCGDSPDAFGTEEIVYRGIWICGSYGTLPAPVLGTGGLVLYNSPIPIPSQFGYIKLDTSTFGNSAYSRDVALHEIGHSLGIGTTWNVLGRQLQEIIPGTTEYCRYIRPKGIEQFQLLNGYSVADAAQRAVCDAARVDRPRTQAFDIGGSVQCGGHWDEDCLTIELMTPTGQSIALDPLSVITIGSLEDLGHTVDYSQAESNSIISNECKCPPTRRTRNLQADEEGDQGDEVGDGGLPTRPSGPSIEALIRAEAIARQVVGFPPELPEGEEGVQEEIPGLGIAVFFVEDGRIYDHIVTTYDEPIADLLTGDGAGN